MAGQNYYSGISPSSGLGATSGDPLMQQLAGYGDMSNDLIATYSKAIASRQQAAQVLAQQTNAQLQAQKDTAMNNAENPAGLGITGASIGTSINPGMGTVIGGAIGLAAGAGRQIYTDLHNGKGIGSALETTANHFLNPIQTLSDIGNVFGIGGGGAQAATAAAPALKQAFASKLVAPTGSDPLLASITNQNVQLGDKSGLYSGADSNPLGDPNSFQLTNPSGPISSNPGQGMVPPLSLSPDWVQDPATGQWGPSKKAQ